MTKYNIEKSHNPIKLYFLGNKRFYALFNRFESRLNLMIDHAQKIYEPILEGGFDSKNLKKDEKVIYDKYSLRNTINNILESEDLNLFDILFISIHYELHSKPSALKVRVKIEAVDKDLLDFLFQEELFEHIRKTLEDHYIDRFRYGKIIKKRSKTLGTWTNFFYHVKIFNITDVKIKLDTNLVLRFLGSNTNADGFLNINVISIMIWDRSPITKYIRFDGKNGERLVLKNYIIKGIGVNFDKIIDVDLYYLNKNPVSSKIIEVLEKLNIEFEDLSDSIHPRSVTFDDFLKKDLLQLDQEMVKVDIPPLK